MMTGQDNFHSRLVAWMKIILPLAALGLLSTLFLLSRKVDLTSTIPFSQVDLEQRAHDQGATNPSFSGVATGGEQISFQAVSVRPDPDRPERMLAEGIQARLSLTNDTVIDIAGVQGEVDQGFLTANLSGNVRVITTTGYDIRTDRLNVEFDTLRAETPGPVVGTGPPGDLSAGRMILTQHGDSEVLHLLFTDGVKLVYKPGEKRE